MFVFFAAPYLAQLFTSDPAVIEVVVLYLRILAISYPFQSMYITYTSLFNVIGHPFYSTLIGSGQLTLVVLPLSFIAFNTFGMTGLFVVVALSYVIIALVSHRVGSKAKELV